MAARKARKITSPRKPKIETSFESPIEMVEEPKQSTGKSKKLLMLVLALFVFALLYYFRSSIVAATVNNKPIFRYQIVKELEKQNGGAVLDDLVTKNLVYQEANKKNVSVSQEDIDNEIKKIEENFVTENQKLDDLLAAQGMTRKDLEERIKFQKLVEKMLEGQLEIKDEEIATYMKENKDLLPKGKSEDEIKAGVRDQLKQEKLTQQFQSWIAGLKQSAKVRYFVKYQ